MYNLSPLDTGIIWGGFAFAAILSAWAAYGAGCMVYDTYEWWRDQS